MALKAKTVEQEGLRNLDDYKSTAEFLSSCKNKATYAAYKSSINHFLKFTAAQNGTVIDPDTMITLDNKKLNHLVLEWMVHLKKNAKSDFAYRLGEVNVNSVAGYCNRVKQWLTYHEIVISWKKVQRFIPEQVQRKWHIYSMDEVRKMLQLASFRERVMVLTLATSGMRLGGMTGLKIQDFKELKGNIGMFVVYAGSPRWYPTFCTPECLAAITFYLKWREEIGETLSPTAPLIRDAVREKLSRAVKRPHHITNNRAWFIMRRLAQKASIPMENLQPDHSFRKLMNTALANRKINPLFKEIMIGHSPKLERIYFDKENPESIDALLEEYVKVSNKLLFNDEYKMKDEFIELREKVKDAPKLEALLHSSIEKDLKIDSMLKELREVRQQQKTQQEFMDQYYKGELQKPK